MTKPFATYVVTDKGIRSVKDVLPGDYVYNSFTGKPMEVEHVVELQPGDVYRVAYSDGRISGYHENQRVVYETCIDGDNWQISYTIPKYISQDKNIPKSTIDRFRLELKSSHISPSPLADPYVAGPFLAYGDLDDPYINLPKVLANNVADARRMIEYLQCKYNMIDNVIVTTDKMYFTTADMKCIPWEMLLGDIGRERLTTLADSRVSMISDYLYASTNDKLQLIRGIFDLGFSKSLSTNYVAIRGTNFSRMGEVRNILSSLGVVSTVMFDRQSFISSGAGVTLYVLNGNIPELFYNRDEVANFVNESSDPNFNNPREISVGSATNISWKKGIQIKYNAYDIVLKGADRHKCYLSGNMLPKASV